MNKLNINDMVYGGMLWDHTANHYRKLYMKRAKELNIIASNGFISQSNDIDLNYYNGLMNDHYSLAKRAKNILGYDVKANHKNLKRFCALYNSHTSQFAKVQRLINDGELIQGLQNYKIKFLNIVREVFNDPSIEL